MVILANHGKPRKQAETVWANHGNGRKRSGSITEMALQVLVTTEPPKAGVELKRTPKTERKPKTKPKCTTIRERTKIPGTEQSLCGHKKAGGTPVGVLWGLEGTSECRARAVPILGHSFHQHT